MGEEKDEQINVGIVGGGDIGSQLLDIFLDLADIKVKKIVDVDSKSPGIVKAEKNNVTTGDDFHQILNDRQIDLVIEVTGSQAVQQEIRENLPQGKDLICGESSYLLYYIVQSYNKAHTQLLNQVTGHLSEVYDKIEDNSLDVSETVTKIEKVTKNLNILAVNASIEAARAGEEGQGFSVVANEVKELAERSNGLVQNIEDINQNISNLNKQISDTVKDLKDEQE